MNTPAKTIQVAGQDMTRTEIETHLEASAARYAAAEEGLWWTNDTSSIEYAAAWEDWHRWILARQRCIRNHQKEGQP